VDVRFFHGGSLANGSGNVHHSPHKMRRLVKYLPHEPKEGQSGGMAATGQVTLAPPGASRGTLTLKRELKVQLSLVSGFKVSWFHPNRNRDRYRDRLFNQSEMAFCTK
jgi:hypothetical protein